MISTPYNTPNNAPNNMPNNTPNNTPPTLKDQVSSTFASQITTALTAVAVLAWTDAFKSLFVQGGYLAKHRIFGPWLIALAATIVAIIGTRAIYNIYPITIIAPTNPPQRKA